MNKECIIDVIKTDSAAVVYAHNTTTDGAVVETATRIAAPYTDEVISNILDGVIFLHVNVFKHQHLVISNSVEKLLSDMAKDYYKNIPVSFVVKSDREFNTLRIEKKILAWSPNVIINLKKGAAYAHA